jgi:hypothetical protein
MAGGSGIGRMFIRGDGAGRSPEEFMLRELRSFPGPIAAACDPFPGAHTLCGGEGEGGRGFAVNVTYVGSDGRHLLVRTKAAPLPIDPDYPPPFVTVDTLRNAFGIYHQRHPGLGERSPGEPPRIPVSVLIDGVAVHGFQVHYPGCSGVELDWNGQTVQCVGEAGDVEELSLRTADETDFAAFVRGTRPS